MAFETASIPSIPFLAELREEVLKHSLKRMPKWKFRFAPDIVVQLQPQPTLLLSAAAVLRGYKPKYQHFVGLAVMMEGVTSEALKQTPKRPCPPWWQTKFEIYAHDPSADTNWFMDQTGGRWQHNAGRSGWTTLFERIVAALRAGYFTASMPPKMLSHHCNLQQGPDRPRLDGALDRPGMRGHQHTPSAIPHHSGSSSCRGLDPIRRRRSSPMTRVSCAGGKRGTANNAMPCSSDHMVPC